MKKILLFLSLGILGLLTPQYALAQTDPTEQKTLPISAENVTIEKTVTDWHENQVTDAKQLPVKQKRETLLPVLDPRGTIRETPVRDQGQVGICWAYSTTDVLAIAKATQLGEKATFSPNYWNYRFAKNAFSDALNPKVYHTSNGGRILDSGAGTDYVLFSVNLGRNPVSENYLNTPKTASTNQPMLSQDFQRIEDKADKSFEVTDTLSALEIPIAEAESKQLEKIKKIKSLVKNYGAVTYNIYSQTSLDLNYAGSNSKYSQKKDGKYTSYVPLSDFSQVKLNANKDSVSIDHAVTIVGWDDTFDKSMFKIQPKNNGAFIVKNSWGTAWGDKGYFYVSYEDMYTTLNRHVTSKVKKTDDEKLKASVTNYYDMMLSTTVNDDLYIASTYDVEKQDETLKAVGFYNLHAGLKYEIYFTEKEIAEKKWHPLTGYEKIGEGTLTEVGLQKISVTEKEISNLKSYSVIIKVVNSKEIGIVKIPLQEVNNNLDGENEIVPAGKSFFTTNNSDTIAYWWNTYNSYNSNIYLNAYVKQEKSEVAESVNLSILNKGNHATILHNYPEVLETEISSQKYTSSDLKWTSSDNDILTVDENGVVTGKGSGKVTVRVELKDDTKVYDTIDMTVDDHGDTTELATPAQLGQPMKVTNDWIIPAMVVSYSEYYDVDVLKYTIPADGKYTVFLEPKGDFNTVAQIKVNGEVVECHVSTIMSILWPSNEKKSISLKKGDEVIVSIWRSSFFWNIWQDTTPFLPQLKQYSLFTLSQEN